MLKNKLFSAYSRISHFILLQIIYKILGFSLPTRIIRHGDKTLMKDHKNQKVTKLSLIFTHIFLIIFLIIAGYSVLPINENFYLKFIVIGLIILGNLFYLTNKRIKIFFEFETMFLKQDFNNNLKNLKIENTELYYEKACKFFNQKFPSLKFFPILRNQNLRSSDGKLISNNFIKYYKNMSIFLQIIYTVRIIFYKITKIPYNIKRIHVGIAYFIWAKNKNFELFFIYTAFLPIFLAYFNIWYLCYIFAYIFIYLKIKQNKEISKQISILRISLSEYKKIKNLLSRRIKSHKEKLQKLRMKLKNSEQEIKNAHYSLDFAIQNSAQNVLNSEIMKKNLEQKHKENIRKIEEIKNEIKIMKNQLENAIKEHKNEKNVFDLQLKEYIIDFQAKCHTNNILNGIIEQNKKERQKNIESYNKILPLIQKPQLISDEINKVIDQNSLISPKIVLMEEIPIKILQICENLKFLPHEKPSDSHIFNLLIAAGYSQKSEISRDDFELLLRELLWNLLNKFAIS